MGKRPYRLAKNKTDLMLKNASCKRWDTLKQALGKMPMRNGSRHRETHPCESANACIYNVCHPVPVDERPLLAETFCGILYHANCISLYALKIKHAFPPLCFLQRPPCCLWYDGVVQASSDSTSDKEETGWTLSPLWIRRSPCCASAAA